MPYYFAKHKTGNFENQPDGFMVINAIENSFWRCWSPIVPNADFIIEIPEQQEEWYRYYIWANGKKLLADAFNGSVKFSDWVDEKGRRAIEYTQEQMSMRLNIIKWIAINVWIPDKQRLKNLSQDIVEQYIRDINAFDNDVLAKEYVVNNLYYDL